MNRRKFIQESAALAVTASILQQCSMTARHSIKGKIVGANSTAGHLLKDAAIIAAPATETIYTDTLIVGGGVSGLSAARWLQQNNQSNFLLIELDQETGGNAASGKNDSSAYPWGAHYVPIPNNNLTEYLSFLEECNVITGYENNLPLINEFYLCFEPQERLYVNGYWQEGLIPHFGVPEKELQEIKRFLAQMETFRLAKGTDGKDAFAIPAGASSSDEQYQNIDRSNMKYWLQQHNYNSAYLHWYINYCCRDDFGTDYSQCSAWAGIHYFAGRKGIAANAPPQSVITWPEGNAWLVKQLKKNIGKNVLVNTIALSIEHTADEVHIKVLDVPTKKVRMIIAKKCIVATPQFVTARLLHQLPERQVLVNKHFNYQPWMVANITTKKLDERTGTGISWDNVLYNGRGLGYVEATHQHLDQLTNSNVLTYYLPLTRQAAKKERELAQKRSFEDWVSIIQQDLSAAHNNFNEQVENIDVWVWGHGMISPQPGFINAAIKKQLQQPVDDRLFFAHTDLSGISIFEEAFYQGIRAAKEVLAIV